MYDVVLSAPLFALGVFVVPQTTGKPMNYFKDINVLRKQLHQILCDQAFASYLKKGASRPHFRRWSMLRARLKLWPSTVPTNPAFPLAAPMAGNGRMAGGIGLLFIRRTGLTNASGWNRRKQKRWLTCWRIIIREISFQGSLQNGMVQ